MALSLVASLAGLLALAAAPVWVLAGGGSPNGSIPAHFPYGGPLLYGARIPYSNADYCYQQIASQFVYYFQQNKDYAPNCIRYAFHDCGNRGCSVDGSGKLYNFGGGCDGSIRYEIDTLKAGEHNGLEPLCHVVIGNIYAKLNAPGSLCAGVSWADLSAVSGMLGAWWGSGKNYKAYCPITLGRTDAIGAGNGKTSNLPSMGDSAATLTSKWQCYHSTPNVQLTMKDAAVHATYMITAAHTYGKSRVHDKDPLVNCKGKGSLDPYTPDTFDNQYCKAIIQKSICPNYYRGGGWFYADNQLWWGTNTDMQNTILSCANSSNDDFYINWCYYYTYMVNIPGA